MKCSLTNFEINFEFFFQIQTKLLMSTIYVITFIEKKKVKKK